MRRDIVARSVKVSIIVGTLLTVINQADIMFGGHLDATVIGKILLTYVVPYGVSTYASVAAVRAGSKY